jgi:predicted GNAT family acetyltransferase
VTLDIRHDESRHRFYVDLDGDTAFLSYRIVDEHTLEYVSTYVPRRHRHRKIGEQLVLRALEYAREGSHRVVPTCWFVETVLELRPEYRDLVAE